MTSSWFIQIRLLLLFGLVWCSGQSYCLSKMIAGSNLSCDLPLLGWLSFRDSKRSCCCSFKTKNSRLRWSRHLIRISLAINPLGVFFGYMPLGGAHQARPKNLLGTPLDAPEGRSWSGFPSEPVAFKAGKPRGKKEHIQNISLYLESRCLLFCIAFAFFSLKTKCRIIPLNFLWSLSFLCFTEFHSVQHHYCPSSVITSFWNFICWVGHTYFLQFS